MRNSDLKINKKKHPKEVLLFIIIIYIFREFKKRSHSLLNYKRLKIEAWRTFQQTIWEKFHSTEKIKKNLLPYFQNKIMIQIGGSLRWVFHNLAMHTKEIIDVNASPEYMGHSIKADYYSDATDLHFIKNNQVDIVSSSHVLEHISNPLKALYEWIRVLKMGGIIYCGVPDKRFMADHQRKRHSLNHIIKDFKNNVKEHDPSHVQENIDKWDDIMDPHWTKEQFVRTLNTNPIGHIHYHAWIKRDVKRIFKYVGLKIIFLALIKNTIHIVGKKKC